MKLCPIPTWTNLAHDDHLMCASCWRSVPYALQMKVQRSWRNFQQAAKPNMRLACLRAYRVARDEAVAVVSSSK